MEVQRPETQKLLEEARQTVASAAAQWAAFRETIEKTRSQIAALKARCADLDERGGKRPRATVETYPFGVGAAQPRALEWGWVAVRRRAWQLPSSNSRAAS